MRQLFTVNAQGLLGKPLSLSQLNLIFINIHGTKGIGLCRDLEPGFGRRCIAKLPFQLSHGNSLLCANLLSADFKGELRRLNKELLFTFLDLLDCLVQRPSAYARAVENVGLIARNMSYILNALRSEQARNLAQARGLSKPFTA